LDLDATDVAILRCLQKDARASLRTIAKSAGVSVPTVSVRLANLERLGVVRGYRLLLNPERLAETMVALVVKTRPQATEAVAAKLAEHDWARRILRGRPGWILVDATVVRREDVDGILREVSSLREVVDVQHFVGLEIVKDEPQALLTERLSARVACFECKGPIQGNAVRVRLDGRSHFFCCHSCERLYLERYGRIRAAARKRP
jgi:DNA-binding Lrp family transcriptional regulator